jgi:hypothetical protein
MPSPAEAEEHLRVIRLLMERATVYRAISAPGALLGGSLAIVTSYVCAKVPYFGISQNFILLWIAVLAITGGVNFGFIWREARKRGAPFFSPGMRLAFFAVLPSYLVAAYLTWQFGNDIDFVVRVWIIGHGLGLLATSHFAPRSFTWLGWAFLVAGIVACQPGSGDMLSNQLWMALTFGFFHLIYAFLTWPRKAPVPVPAFES